MAGWCSSSIWRDHLIFMMYSMKFGADTIDRDSGAHHRPKTPTHEHTTASTSTPQPAIHLRSPMSKHRKSSLSTISCAFTMVTLVNSASCFFLVLLQDLPGCHALSSMPLSSRRITQPYPGRYHHQYQHIPTSSRPTTSSSQLFSQAPTVEIEGSRPKPDVSPFNHDIARTIFATLFFSLYHYKNEDQSSSSIRHHYERPSPFEDPSCAQTAERMLRRMIDNRYRSDGRTVCPDGRTFSLVAGAFGRLRCGSAGRRNKRKVNEKMVTWEEEPSRNPLNPYKSEIGDKTQVTPVHKLQQILQLQLQLCHWEGWPTDIVPSADMYNRVLKRLAWQSGRFRSEKDSHEVSPAEQAWLWLQFMKSPLPPNHITDEEKSILCQPDAITYMHVIDALSSHRAPVLSESGINDSSSLVDTESISVFESIYTLADQIDIDMTGSRKAPTDLSPEWFLTEAEKLLLMLEDDHSKSKGENDELKRTLAHSYRCMLEGWGRYAVSGVSVHSDRSHRNSAAEKTAGQDKPSAKNREHAIERAYELLGSLEKLTGAGKSSETQQTPISEATFVPSSCYSSVMLALSVSNHPSAANMAEDVLQRMLSQYGIDQTYDFDIVELPQSLFNANDMATAFSGGIAAHAKSNDAPKAEKILNQMLELYHSGQLGTEFVPEVRAFGTSISLWQKYDPTSAIHSSSRQRPKNSARKELPSPSQRFHNAERAEAILCELEGVAELEWGKGNHKFVLHATPYNIAILARVQTIDRNKYYDDNEENEQIILQAQTILDHMEYEMGVTPDPYTYSILLHAWCQQSRPGNENAADYAEELLRRRIEDTDISKIYGDDMAASSPWEKTHTDIWPNVKHYSSVLKAHAKTKSAGGAKKALALLSEMEQRFYDANIIDGGNDSDINGVAGYHVDQKDVAKPDLVCYSIVIDAFANSRLPEASSVADRLLKAVETKYGSGDLTMAPNTRIYTAVILSLVHSPFIESEESKKKGKNINNAQRAWSILERMKENDCPPNSFTYNYIINCAATQACHSEEEQRVSFEIALRAFQELRKASRVEPDNNGCILDPCHPNSFTFAFMLKACNNLLPPGTTRNKVMSHTFSDCCRSGYLNDAVLDRLWRGLSAEEFYELVEETPSTHLAKKNAFQNKSPLRVDNLPISWSRCCNSGQRQSRKSDEYSWKKGQKLVN